MSHIWRKRLAVAFTVTGLLLYALAVVFAYLGRSAPLPPDWGPWYSALIFAPPMLLGLILGSVLIVKLPHNPYGWVWIVLGLAFGSLRPLSQYYAIYALMVAPAPLPLGWAAAYVGGMSWFVGLSMMPLVLLLFPTGRPPTRRWYLLLWMVILALIVGLATAWAYGTAGTVPIDDPNKLSGPWGDLLSRLGSIAIGAIFVAIPLGAVSLLHRYRLATQGERQQLKWFAYGTLIFVLFFASDFVYTAPGAWEPVKEALISAILPVTIGVAILRYRLWDIDVVIRKTLVFSVLTMLLALVYFGSVVLLQQMFGRLTGVEQSPLAVVVSTLLIAALFTPLRSRLQHTIDRRFFRGKYDAQQVLAQFAQSARDETDLDALNGELVRIVQETMQPERVSIWMRETKRTRNS